MKTFRNGTKIQSTPFISNFTIFLPFLAASIHILCIYTSMSHLDLLRISAKSISLSDMSLQLTKAEKADLLRNLRLIKEKHVIYLRQEADRISKGCEKAVLRRQRKVNMVAQPLRIGDVLEMERRETPTIQKLQEEMSKKEAA